MITKKKRTKLELIRIEGICRMLLSKVEHEMLTNIVEAVTQVASQDIKKAIFRLPRYQLIRIIELAGSAVTEKDIDETYEQYRYGLKPGFTLFSIIKESKSISINNVFKTISERLAGIPYSEDDNIKNIVAKSQTKGHL